MTQKDIKKQVRRGFRVPLLWKQSKLNHVPSPRKLTKVDRKEMVMTTFVVS